MSFGHPQETARRSYSQASQPHPVFAGPQSQAPTSYFQSHEPAPLRDVKNVPNSIQRESPSPSDQLRENSYIYQLQQGAQPSSQSLGPPQNRNTFEPTNPQARNGVQPPQNGNPTQQHPIGAQPPIRDVQTATPELTAAILKMTPPPEGTYPTFEALLAAANGHALERGYAMVIGRSKRKNKVGLKKVLLTCDKGGTSKHTMLPLNSPLRKRCTTSRKTGCMFGIYAIETQMEWTLKYRPDPACSVHNHGPSKGAIEHPAARKLDATAVAAVKALKDAGVSAQETLKQIQAAQPGAKLIARDVYNARAALRREPSRASLDPAVVPVEGMTTIYKRATMSREDRFKDDCRTEIAKLKEELEKVTADNAREVEALKKELEVKDQMIAKFEMFIDICNGRVMMQRDKLA